MKALRFFGLACLGLLASAALGGVVIYDFPIDGTQEVPPTGSPGTGEGHVELNTGTNRMSWNIVFRGLGSPEVAAHFHRAPRGVNGPVIIPLPLGSPKIGEQVLTDQQEADVLAGLFYVNIHSEQFPGGEIRGQVVPEPATLSLLLIGSLAVLRRRC